MNPLAFVRNAEAMAEHSKDPSTKVGCVVIDVDSNIIASGFNGFPRGVNDDQARYADRTEKLKFVAHAEANAIAQAARTGAKLLGGTMILTALYPCSNCAKLIIQAGIRKIYAPVMDRATRNASWFHEMGISSTMFEEAGVEVVTYHNGSPVMDEDIYSLELSVRTLNCLKTSDILTVKDLASTNEEYLLSIPAFGKNCLREVKSALEDRGLGLVK